MSKWIEAIPLSETDAVAFAKALTFTWISRLRMPKMITSDHGPQFTSNLWLQLCEMLNFHTNKQQLITLRQTAQSKDCTAASRMLFTQALLQQHGPRSFPLYSWTQSTAEGRHWSFPG
jgi:hypothetical protein